MLRAVAMVHVPIDQSDPAGTVPAHRVAHGDRAVVEHAEAEAVISFSVMAGWSHEAIGIAEPTSEYRVHRHNHAAGGERPDLKAAGPKRRLTACMMQRGIATGA